MYTARIKDKGVKNDVIAVQVEFSNGGGEPVSVNFTGRTVDEINKTIGNYKAALEQRDTELAALSLGEWTAPIEEAKVVDEPTAEETAEAAWFAAKGKLEQALALKNMAVDAGRNVTPERQAEIDALAEYVDINFKDEYVK